MARLVSLSSIALDCTPDFSIYSGTKLIRLYIGSLYLIPGSAARLNLICLGEDNLL